MLYKTETCFVSENIITWQESWFIEKKADMDKLTVVVTCIYYLAFYVTATPVYHGDITSLDDIYDLCNSEAINRIISDSSDQLPDFRSSMRNENDANAILYSLSRREGNELAGAYGNKISVIGKNNQLRDVLDTVNALRKSCIFEYISQKRSQDKVKKDAEQYESLSSDNFSDLRRTDSRSVESGQFSDSVKRNRAIGLNPTGWRKRRSDSKEPEDLSKFLRNMRELLEKRERLSFNPTGW